MDSKMTYREKTDIDNTLRLREVLKSLPPFCRDYFRAMESTTTTKTRISYAYDIRIFFQFLLDSNPAFKEYSMTDFTVDVLLDFELQAFEQESFNVLTVSGSHILLELKRVMRLDSASTDADSTGNHLDGSLLDVVAVLTEFIIAIVGKTTEVVVELTRSLSSIRIRTTSRESAFGVVGEHFNSASAVRVEGRS